MTSTSIKAKRIPPKTADYCMKSLKIIIPSDPAYSYQQGPDTPNLDLGLAKKVFLVYTTHVVDKQKNCREIRKNP